MGSYCLLSSDEYDFERESFLINPGGESGFDVGEVASWRTRGSTSACESSPISQFKKKGEPLVFPLLLAVQRRKIPPRIYL